MYRLLLLVLVLSLGGATGSSRAASEWSTVEIFSVDLAGRQTNLTHDPAWDVNPAVARDGRIAFFTNRIGGGLDAMDANGGAVRLVTAGGGIEVAEDLEWSQASWAPRGDRLAFDGLYLANPDPGCSHYCAGWHLLTVAADGSGLTEIARNARAPAWSPDGRRIAYENWTGPNDLGGPSGVTISSPDGSSAVKLTAFPLGDLRPVWSPRGGELAFGGVQRTAPRLGIYVVRADGTQMRRLTRGGDPSWSPDGHRFAFIRDGRLFTIGSNGKGRRRLSRKGEFVVGQAWAPKGHLIAYVEGKARNHGGCGVPGTIEVRDCVVPGSLRLKTVNANSGRVRVLMAERWTSFWGDPVWMPSAKRVLLTVQL